MIPDDNTLFEQLHSVTQAIGETMMGMYLSPTKDASPSLETTQGYRGHIAISGQWNGAVLMHCDKEMAEQLTRAMLPSHSYSTSKSEDVLAEILNMVGGNMKALLPGPSRLSLPKIIENSAAHPARIQEDSWVAFESNGHTLWLTIHEGDLK